MRMINTRYADRKNYKKTVMNLEDFRREHLFQATFSIIKTMYTMDVITTSDLHLAEMMLLEKYKPIFGMLHSSNAALLKMKLRQKRPQGGLENE